MSQHEYFHRSKAVIDANGIALRALASVVARPHEQTNIVPPKGGPSDDEIHQDLMNAVRKPQETSLECAIEKIVASGTSSVDMASIHIPEVARALGKAWTEDQMEFANVSIGCARLQGYLRRKGLDWCDTTGLQTPAVSTVLLAVPDFEQHTLGATLLAGQLRAQNICVSTELYVSEDELQRAAKKQEYDAIMISSSRSETIALLCATILELRNHCAGVPIIVGGNLLEQTPDVLEKTGADFTANCWQDAVDILTSRRNTREVEYVDRPR